MPVMSMCTFMHARAFLYPYISFILTYMSRGTVIHVHAHICMIYMLDRHIDRNPCVCMNCLIEIPIFIGVSFFAGSIGCSNWPDLHVYIIDRKNSGWTLISCVDTNSLFSTRKTSSSFSKGQYTQSQEFVGELLGSYVDVILIYSRSYVYIL